MDDSAYSATPAPGFTALLLAANPELEAVFAAWLFADGMRFGEWRKWWKPGSERRKLPHEGLDLLTFKTNGGKEGRLAHGLRIPALFAGTITAIVPDFLGHTVAVACAEKNPESFRLHIFYAHLAPAPGLRVGDIIEDSLTIGWLPESKPAPTVCPPHLHLSLALVSSNFRMADFSWNRFVASEQFRPCDPYPFL